MAIYDDGEEYTGYGLENFEKIVMDRMEALEEMLMKRYKRLYLVFLPLFCIGIITSFISFLERQEDETRELSKEELQEKEKAREARLQALLPSYFSNTNPETDFYFSLYYPEINDRYLQNCCAYADFCAVVKVTRGLEYDIDEISLLDSYQEYYDTSEKELTEEQKQKLLMECPKFLLYVKGGGEVILEVEEYLFNKTGEKAKTITIDVEQPHEMAFLVCTGMRLVCFFRISTEDINTYSCIWGWKYYLTDENYLVPMSLRMGKDMIRYGGKSLKEYKEIIQESYDRSEKRWAILTYLFDNIAEKEPDWILKGNYLILEEKKKGKKRELYLLAATQKSGREKTRYGYFDTTKKEGGLLYIRLKKQGNRYVAEDGYWNWEGSEEHPFSERIGKLAKEYGYPDGNYIEQIGEDRWYTQIETVEEYRKRYP